jgi:hypothetical protein
MCFSAALHQRCLYFLQQQRLASYHDPQPPSPESAWKAPSVLIVTQSGLPFSHDSLNCSRFLSEKFSPFASVSADSVLHLIHWRSPFRMVRSIAFCPPALQSSWVMTAYVMESTCMSTRLDVYLSSKSSTWSGRRARRTFFSSEHHKKRWSESSNKPSVEGMIISHHSVHSFKWMITFTYLLATQMPFWGHFFYDLSSY